MGDLKYPGAILSQNLAAASTGVVDDEAEDIVRCNCEDDVDVERDSVRRGRKIKLRLRFILANEL